MSSEGAVGRELTLPEVHRQHIFAGQHDQFWLRNLNTRECLAHEILEQREVRREVKPLVAEVPGTKIIVEMTFDVVLRQEGFIEFEWGDGWYDSDARPE